MGGNSDQRGLGPRAVSLQGQNLDLPVLSEHTSLASLCLWALVSPYGTGLKQKPPAFLFGSETRQEMEQLHLPTGLTLQLPA